VKIVANPFLSELDGECRLGRILQKLPLAKRLFRREKPALWALAVLFPLLGAIATYLSILSRAGAIDVKLVPLNGGPDTVTLHVGYLYELNAALFYLAASWVWVLAFLWFLQQSDNAVSYLTRKGRLRGPASGVREEIGRLNRRWFSGWLMLAIVLVTSVVIIGTEFNPVGKRGDYWRLAFGYVQASAMPAYKTDVAIDKIGREITNREIKKIPMDKYRLAEPLAGPTTEAQRRYFPWFLVFAIGVESLFAPFAAWTVIKVGFVLRMLYRAVADPRYSLKLEIVHDDCEKQFGFSELNRVYRSIAYLVFVSMSAEIASAVANVDKGSGRALDLSAADPLAVILGQGAVSIAPVFLLVFLLVFLTLFSMRIRSMHAPLRAQAISAGQEDEAAERIRAQRFVLFDVLGRFRVGTLIYMFAPLLIRLRWERVSPLYERWRHAADKVDRYFG
jgi:hypothetical protein